MNTTLALLGIIMSFGILSLGANLYMLKKLQTLRIENAKLKDDVNAKQKYINLLFAHAKSITTSSNRMREGTF